MKINIKNFKELLKKSTINNVIKTVQLNFAKGKVYSSMISGENNAISIINIENNILSTNDEVDFNFSEPSQEVIPYLNIFDEDEVNINLYKNKIILKNNNQQTKIGFCSPTIVTLFGKSDVKDNSSWFFETKIDNIFYESFNKIKKIGPKFGRVYFEISNNNFIIETTDKTNEFANGLKFILNSETNNDENIRLCFLFNEFLNIMKVITDSDKEFTIKFTYNNEQELGLLYIISDDNSEKYCLFSTRE